jgi:hypothetical protein
VLAGRVCWVAGASSADAQQPRAGASGGAAAAFAVFAPAPTLDTGHQCARIGVVQSTGTQQGRTWGCLEASRLQQPARCTSRVEAAAGRAAAQRAGAGLARQLPFSNEVYQQHRRCEICGEGEG